MDCTKGLAKSSSSFKAPEDWVIESGVEESFRKLSYAIAVVVTPYGRVGLYANPKDQRCYRMIARLLVKDPSDLHLNAFHSLDESLAVGMAVAVTKQVVFETTGLFVQSMHLGNNSMCSTSITGRGDVGLATEQESYFYHEHLILRGDPTRSYFPGATALGGPPLGTAFAAQGRRVEPTPESLNAVVDGTKNVLRQRKQEGIWERAGCLLDTT